MMFDRAKRAWRRLALLAVALGVLLAVAWPAQAAMELMFFHAESTDTAVLLSWATAREIDVEGYLILCKRQNEPESAYHVVGQRAAIGGPDVAAQYSFAATEDVYYGEQYCFRLEEVTTNDEPGEKRDICGYGPGVTPTPVVGELPFGSTGTLTPIIVTPLPGLSPAPTLYTPGPTPTWTPVGFSPIATPPQFGSPLATPQQFGSPLATPLPTWTQVLGGESFTASPTWTPSPTATGTQTPTATQPGSPLAAATNAPIAAAGTSAGEAQYTPTPLYIVVTATPTAEELAAAPALTALPTVTSTPDLGLLSVLTPSAQSMMVMMLCLIFLSATGLGTLGLVTTILYFRSQAQRRTDGNDFSGRRRF